MKTHSSAIAVVTAVLAASAGAATVQVEVTGTVEFNGISQGPLGNVNPNDAATLSFTVDSNNFVNDLTFPTRGYVIDHASFALTMGATTVALQNPFPAGQTPYFVLRNNDPAVDGFFIATNTVADTGVPLNVTGAFGQFISQFKVTYGNDPLPSLNILDALGTYDFTGLTVFNWTVDDGPFQPLGLLFGELTISGAGCVADLDGNGNVGFSDILQIIGSWGFCPGCPADLSGNGQVDFADILIVIGAWGPC